MHLEFLVEDLSTEETLCHLLPNILSDSITFETHSFQGKQNLLSKLPNRLKGYKAWIPDYYRIYQGQTIANPKGLPLKKITSAEIRQNLENLTGSKTRLRGVDRAEAKHYKSGKIS